MLARSASVTLAARYDDPLVALAEVEALLEQWLDLRNEASQWGVLTLLVSLLVRVGDLRGAAVLAGAVRANRDRQPLWQRNEEEVLACIERVGDELDRAEAGRLLASGAAMSVEAALVQARQAIDLAREGLSPGTPR
jgi:hypothetical protein